MGVHSKGKSVKRFQPLSRQTSKIETFCAYPLPKSQIQKGLPMVDPLNSGISKPMVCQTYGLCAGRLSRKRRKSRKRRRRLRQLQMGAKKKTNKQKTHKHFSDGPCGTIVPGTNPHLSQGQTGQNGDFTVELNRERPVCPRDGSHFVPGRGPICPKDGSCLSRTPSRRKCLCLLVFFLPERKGAFRKKVCARMYASLWLWRSECQMYCWVQCPWEFF